MQDIEGIRARLPLRYPYLMVDRIVEETDDEVVAWKNVTINEPFFQGHFPEPLEAVMPGTLIVEAMAQTAGFLARGKMSGYLVGADKVRIRRKVVPGDRLCIRAMRLRERRGLLQAECEATVDGETAASAVISLFLTEAEDAR
jgi:3-hydroxyacyl-[acyl-carrier-protein] dehydratase